MNSGAESAGTKARRGRGSGQSGPAFGYSAATIRFWRQAVRAALQAGAGTPFYLFSPQPVAAMLGCLEAESFGRPAVHWLSTKTQPLPELLRWWRSQGRPAEVVSEAEFQMAEAAGFDVESLLVNGPAKHRWVARHSRPGLRVNFDSAREVAELLPLARRDKWRVGLRLCTTEEFDPENPTLPTQFGFTPDEAAPVVRKLRRAGLPVETLHFHLRTNVAGPDCYARALAEVADFVAAAGLGPKHLDIGGGLPPPHVLSRAGKRLDAGISVASLAQTVRRALKRLPSVEQVWLENGRFVSAGSGLLAVRVLEVKERPRVRQLICDGGRTLNALVSVWEQHELVPLRAVGGPETLTAVHGPTCMAFDQLARKEMPLAIRAGEVLLWLEAGAYHLPWETRFSHGLAEVWWHDNGSTKCVRPAG